MRLLPVQPSEDRKAGVLIGPENLDGVESPVRVRSSHPPPRKDAREVRVLVANQRTAERLRRFDPSSFRDRGRVRKQEKRPDLGSGV